MSRPGIRAQTLIRRIQTRTSRIIGKPRPIKYGTFANYATKTVTKARKKNRKAAADIVRAYRNSIK